MPPRFVIQGIVKKLARSVGLEIRYAFQNPPLTSAAIYAPWLVRDNVTCIFDVGANVGQSAQAFAREFSGSTIHSFEPFPAAYGRLEKLAKASNGRIRAYKLACGASAGHMDITIDDICDRQDVTKIDILKTDTEGYDAEVLAGARRMLSEERVRCIICEVGFLDDKQHTDFTKVFLFLHRLGFEIAGIYEPSYFSNYRMAFTNALFVRRV